jgi:hypothetical protein
MLVCNYLSCNNICCRIVKSSAVSVAHAKDALNSAVGMRVAVVVVIAAVIGFVLIFIAVL